MPEILFQDLTNSKPDGLFSRIRQKPFYYLIACLIIINITLILINIGIWLMAAHQKLFITADFTNFYTGFKMVMNDDGSRLYDLALQAEYQQRIMGNINFSGGLLPYVNPPFVAIIFAPLSLLPVRTAFYVWTTGEFALLIWLIFLLNKLFAKWDKQERLAMNVLVLAFWPLTINFLHGQFSLLLLVSILQVYIAMRQSRHYHAGLWLTFLLVKPQSLPLLGVMTLNKRFWRIAMTAILTCAVIFILSSALLGCGIWIRYVRVLPDMLKNFGTMGFLSNFQYTFRGILTNILGYAQAGTINVISIFVLLGGGFFIWLMWLNGPSLESAMFTLYFALAILLSSFLSLHLYPHDDLILVLPAILMYDYLREYNFPRKVYSVFILISPLVFFIAAFYDFNLFGFIHPPVVLIFCLLVWVGYYLILERRKQQITPSTTQSS